MDEIEQKSPAYYALGLATGLIKIETAAKHIGLDTKSPIYKRLQGKPAK
jgi:hypothetical protein